ncbi:Putative cytochrome P450 120 [BD1-7 clade bacterium]|uniref:Cytochrome P450 120 n=1 Tax=BD1-7 clade bacterium TaxID=2029982 RepID=A0A5S9PRE9_9GAMM|nr:Putative cytochrome P450 120 [BD1-7 clade bacterium]
MISPPLASYPEPPTVPGLPIIGSALHAMGRDPRDFLMAQYDALGPVFRLKAMHIDYVVMAGPDANQFANVEGRGCFESNTFWRGMMHELEADNFLIGLDGDDHTYLRKLFKADFSKAAMEPHADRIYQLCVDIFAHLEPGQKIAVVEPMLQLTSQMIGCIMSGKVPTRDELHDFLYYVNEVTNHFTLRRLPAWLLRFRLGRFRQSKIRTMAFADAVIASRLSGQGGMRNFVDAVVDAGEKCPHLFAPGDLRFSAILPLFAGIDTLGQTLNYALFELHRHPQTLTRVREEVDTVFAAGIPNTEQLKNMPLLNAAVSETLRLHPSAFGMVRTANQDFVFKGHSIKKGQDVVILTTASHFMDAYFESPKAFEIDRFLPPRNEHRQRNVFAPFGRGPHTCLGAGLSESLMALALGSILYNYLFEPLDPNQAYKERISPTPSLGSQFVLTLKAKRFARAGHSI